MRSITSILPILGICCLLTATDIKAQLSVTASGTNASCIGSCDGFATASAIGGITPYNYLWDDGASQTTSTATGLCVGTYNVTVTDAGGDTASAAVTIFSAPPITLNVTTNNITCNGLSDGSACLSVSGGLPPFTYSWSPSGSTGSCETGMSVGNSTGTATDANGCTASVSVTINEPAALVITTSSIGATCGNNDGQATVTGSGGTIFYTYQWSDVAAQTTATATGLIAGLYDITLTDANGCSATASVLVSTVSSISSQAICLVTVDTNSTYNIVVWEKPVASDIASYNVYRDFGGFYSLIGNVPYNSLSEFSDSTGGADPNVTSYRYKVTAVDFCGGESSLSNYHETIHLTINLGIPSTTMNLIWDNYIGFAFNSFRILRGATINSLAIIDSVGPGIFSYTDFSIPPGTLYYRISAVHPSGCTATKVTTYSETISNAAGYLVGGTLSVTTTTTNASMGNCDGTATATASNGTPPYTYVWNTSPVQTTQTATGLCAGTYSVSVSDAVGDTASASVTIIETGGALTATASSTNASAGNCDGTATVTVSGGLPPYAVVWNDSLSQTTFTATGLCAGTYIVTVMDASGDTVSASVTVIETTGGCNPAFAYSDSGNTVIFTDLSIGSITGWLWDFGDGNSSIVQNPVHIYMSAGTYTVCLSVYDTSICGQICSTIVVGTCIPPVLSISSTANSCYGSCDGSALASTTGGVPPYTYLWSNGGNLQAIAAVCAGTYSVTVTGSDGCTATSSVTISEPTAMILTVTTVDASCGNADGIASVNVSNGTSPYTYAWSSGDTISIASNLSSGIYILTVTDANGCSESRSVSISDAGAAVIVVNSSTNVLCNGGATGAINISAFGGITPYTYLWSNGSTTQDILNLTAGPYEVSVTDAGGCIAIQSISITEPLELNISASSTDASCGGADGTATINVSGGTPSYAYSWSSGGASSSETGLSAGVYDVTITDANGCAENVSIAISEAGGAIITTDSIIDASCGGDGDIYIDVNCGFVGCSSYLWSNGAVTEDLTGVSGGAYSIIVTTNNGCIATASFTIESETPLPESICLVTVDSVTGKNLIVWEKTQIQGIRAYNIYRESSQANIYFLADSVPYSNLSVFLDILSDPLQRAYRYKLSTVDSCGNESDLSDHHKTIHLTMNIGIGGEINLIWNHYEGYSYLTYYIYRYSDSIGWELLDSIPSNLNSYTDQTPPSDVQSYRVSANHPIGCTATKSGTYERSSSNLVTVPGSTNTNELQLQEFEFRVYPNPNQGQFTLEMELKLKTNLTISVYHFTGQLHSTVEIKNVSANYKHPINLSDLSRGVYFVRIVSDYGSTIKKVVSQ